MHLAKVVVVVVVLVECLAKQNWNVTKWPKMQNDDSFAFLSSNKKKDIHKKIKRKTIFFSISVSFFFFFLFNLNCNDNDLNVDDENDDYVDRQ